MNIIWAVIFFLLLSLGITYVSWHIWQILPIGILAKWVVVSLLLACIVCFFTNFFVGLDHYPMAVSKFLYELGNSSIFITLYLAMVFIILDIGRIAHLIPKSFMFGSRLGTASILILVVAIFIYGYFNYERKERVQLNVEKTDKIVLSVADNKFYQYFCPKIIKNKQLWQLKQSFLLEYLALHNPQRTSNKQL